MNIWMIAGETSGDIYGAHICRELKKINPEVTVKGMGGLAMKEAGVEILADSTELGVMGLIEVLKLYPTFHRIFHGLLKRAKEEKPDAILMIDYPGFNLRFAKKLFGTDIPVVWYVGPQVWAWNKKRIPIFARVVEKMMLIFPFETKVWENSGLDTEFVGHPLPELLDETTTPVERDSNLVLLLPGSRASEINRLLVPFLETALLLVKEKPELKFLVPTPRESSTKLVKEIIAKTPGADTLNIRVETGKTEQYMLEAGTAIATSGTVTVQAAIQKLPLVSCYKMNQISYEIMSRLVKLPYFTMINLLLEREVFREFIQHEVQPPLLKDEMLKILPDGERRDEVEKGMDEMMAKLGGGQGALANAARVLYETAEKKNS